MRPTLWVLSPFVFKLCYGSPYNPLLTSYNLNTNQTATSPLYYHTNRSNTTYTPSPQNWRSLPIYTVLLDKLSNGDPTNDDFFQTPFESDPGSPGSSGGGTQLRFGGDIKGLGDERVLDYLEGMGVGVVYVAGTVFVNEVWEGDGYSPLDFSVIDPHWGTWEDWVEVVDRVHGRGMNGQLKGHKNLLKGTFEGIEQVGTTFGSMNCKVLVW
ncbi:glycoside hydrolase superfamily [Lentinula boryana]|uniref:Glycoside hydrolase superfamily n=1 Tax=Lentinula boryana TaxID=40481 RepID=A0ABQ8Q6D9_9AGAR|nr:glycoside hydrolase superfamily [Lentinula boryana]